MKSARTLTAVACALLAFVESGAPSSGEATVSDDGSHLRDGRWFGPGVAPGTWTADWTSADTPKP